MPSDSQGATGNVAVGTETLSQHHLLTRTDTFSYYLIFKEHFERLSLPSFFIIYITTAISYLKEEMPLPDSIFFS